MSSKDSLENYEETLEKADKVLKELEDKLSNVSVNVSKSSEDVIEAVRSMFGSSYIKSNGTTTITFDMYKIITAKLREVGSTKVGEYL